MSTNPDVSVNIDTLSSIPLTCPASYVSIQLDNRSTAYLNNGTYINFDYQTLGLLTKNLASSALRISSMAASSLYKLNDMTYVWPTVLEGAKYVNLHGQWDDELLSYFLENMPNLATLSLTYGGCFNIYQVLTRIASRSVYELTLHVGIQQKKQVINALPLLVDWGIKLKRLMLVFADPFEEFDESLIMPILEESADVVLLHGGENYQCLDAIKSLGYIEDGQIQMAQNQHYNDCEFKKQYETYKVFSKTIQGRRIRQGSLIGKYFIPAEKEAIEKPISTGSPTISLPCSPNIGIPFYKRPIVFPLVGAEFEDMKRLASYGPLNDRQNDGDDEDYEYASRTCCNPGKDVNDMNFKRWRIPGFKETRVQKIIYHEVLTEYLTSNGFYLRLDSMDMESRFYAQLFTSRRLEIECVSYFRLNLASLNFEKFLSNAIHIEFVGEWDMRALALIGTQISKSTQKITMLRFCIHRKEPIRNFVENSLQMATKKSLTHFHYDARDTEDQSIGSAYNGIRKSIFVMQEIIIVGNTWSSPRFPCQLKILISDMCDHLVPNGTCTVVVMEAKFSYLVLFEEGFNQQFAPVLIQPPFRQQGCSMFPKCISLKPILMMTFQACIRQRFFYVVIPWDHNAAKLSVLAKHGRRSITCPQMNY